MDKLKFIEQEGLIVIFRGMPHNQIKKTIKALHDGGVRVIEITFNPSDPDTIANTKALINEAKSAGYDDMMFGVGTAICEEHVVAAYEAGAEFVFSPDTDEDVIKLTKKLGMLSIPGALTPTEFKAAYKYGADMVKLFPSTEDKLGYIVNITRPLSHIPFMCTGGTNENTIKGFIKAGAKCVGTGISILKPELLQNEDYAEITRLAKLHIDRIKEARSEL